MSRTFTIEELNDKIDRLVSEYKNNAEECFQELGDEEQGNEYLAKVEALLELKGELNDPRAIVNVTENIQQTLNVIETKKIIGDELH